ncbi:hypothetical protein LINGRAHAP2_LOCUS16522, partial [Linum grandiflorum]
IRAPIQLYVHLSFEDPLCTASLTPLVAAPAFRLTDDCRRLLLCWSSFPPSRPPSHPTIGHRYRCGLRL